MKTKKERLGPGFFYLFIGQQLSYLCFWPGKVRNPIPCKGQMVAARKKMGWDGWEGWWWWCLTTTGTYGVGTRLVGTR
jgi:hypothetical protein